MTTDARKTESGPDGDSEPEEYNKVLELYVREENPESDLVGLLAYALYKRQKREWLIDFRRSAGGRSPSTVEIAALTRLYLTRDQRETLRERAIEMLNGYAETFIEAAEPGIREDAISSEALGRMQTIQQTVKDSLSLWSSVKSGIVATALWTLLVTAVVVAGALFGSDWIDVWNAIAQSTST